MEFKYNWPLSKKSGRMAKHPVRIQTAAQLDAAFLCGYSDVWAVFPRRDIVLCEVEKRIHNDMVTKSREQNIRASYADNRCCQFYAAAAWRVLSCIQKGTGSIIRDKLLSDIIDYAWLDTITVCDIYEIDETSNKAERDFIERRRAQKDEVKTSSMYKCRKCGYSETQISKNQTRAGDEAGTINITCVKCGFKWR